jgi:hypothetical protein
MYETATSYAHIACPICGSAVQRVRRRPTDRLLSLFAPVRRFRCADSDCGWEDRVRRSSVGGVSVYPPGEAPETSGGTAEAGGYRTR